MKIYEYICDILNVAGVAYGAANITEILGIVLLILNIVTIVVRASLKLYQWHKKAKADGVITTEEIDEAIQIIDATKDEIDKGGKNNG